MTQLPDMIKKINSIVWGPWLLILLLGTGVYLMLSLRLLPLKNLKYALLCAIGKDENGKKLNGERCRDGISSFSSLTTELAATIGTGNIVGVATAMVLGGPGALFWMIVSALLGMSTKLVESMLSVKYRSRNDRGERVGGPMYTMRNAFQNKRAGQLLGNAFALFAVMASLGMGNMTQSNSIADALNTAFHLSTAKTGLVLTVLTVLVVLGGIQSISKVTQYMVPGMGAFYLLGTLLVIFNHIDRVPAGLVQIVVMAFCPQAVAGGVLGGVTVTVQQSLRRGISRGVFSNEAGLGAAGISAAAADTDDYVRQGYISMTGVFIDTVVICFLTGLALSVSGVLGSTDALGRPLMGTALTIAAFEDTFGSVGAYFVSICIVLFAFATVIGWAYQGERAFEFLVKKSKYCIWYRFFYALTAFVGALSSLELVWEVSDICNGLMAVPNLLCILVLSGPACREIRNEEKRKNKKKVELQKNAWYDR